MVLFPRTTRNSQMTTSLSYTWFIRGFRLWVDELDLGRLVPHQARHTLATNLLRHGATLTHIRRYLGQVSDRMAEHYVHLTSSDLENVLQHVWVAGPGAAQPGELLAGDTTPLTRQQAQALAIDLSRRSTPAEGGFCTFQPVVDGGACPWNRDLEAEWTEEASQRITTENTTLKQRVRQLTSDNRTLDERLKAARSNLRFQDRRIADLEAQIADSTVH
ncbi:tyrosine-type recombinase/integrase [Streptomyces sp. NPDC060188]|uniref:tyrosine-type recombinase/integrase n=1 Tax=Streptomyces sp. NPDC060188 TaxID=3347068 RepID=UPI00364937E3